MLRFTLVLLVVLVLVTACAPAAVTTPAPTDTQQPTTSPPAVTEPPPTEAPTQEPLAEIDPEALLQGRCTRCHNLDRVVQARKSVEEWTATVDSMIGRGAELNAEEREALIEYLALTYPHEPAAAEIDAEALLQDRCTRCHNLDRVVQAQKSAEGWTATVDGMIGRGAELNAEEREALIEYLTLTYPQ